MLRTFLFLLVVSSIISCKDTVSDMNSSQEANWQVSIASLPSLTRLAPKAKMVLTDWKEYGAFKASLDRVYNTENREDLLLVLEELIENQKIMEASDYPEAFDILQIKARQKVVKTYVLKAKGDLEYRQNPQASLIQVIKAFNELINQFNVAVQNTFLEEIQLNEEN